ncbi:MAG: helix-turn-helix domain-containing protein [Candidatus Anstonellaceae archaeon]
MDKVKAATIGVFHHDCQTSFSTEKHPGITLDQISPVVYLSKKKNRLDYSLMWDITAHSPSELEEYLKYVKNDKKTIKLHVLDKGKNHALILLRFRGAHSTYDAVLSNGVTATTPVVAKAGYEIYHLIAHDPNNIEKMMRELSCIGDVKVMKMGAFDPKSISKMPKITDKQKDALEVALINNYYSWPRGATLEKLAEVADLSRRSMQERLRRAEAKLIPYALKEFLKRV